MSDGVLVDATAPAVEALRAMRDRPGIPVVSTGLFFHVELGWYGRGERRVVLLDDDHYHDKKIGIPICAALERHYLPDSMKSLPECLEEFDALKQVLISSQRG